MILKPLQIIDAVAQVMEFNVEDIINKKSRKQQLTLCRHIAYYYIRRFCVSEKSIDYAMTYQEIGKIFNKHHATIIFGEKNIENYIQYNSDFRMYMISIDEIIKRKLMSTSNSVDGLVNLFI